LVQREVFIAWWAKGVEHAGFLNGFDGMRDVAGQLKRIAAS
jgi:hypothetical protein